MSRFSDRVERDLNQIADHATPSSSAWDSIQARIAEQAPEETVEVIMLHPDQTPTRQPRTLLAAAAAALAIVLGGVIFATARSDGDGDGDLVDSDLPVATDGEAEDGATTTEAPTTTEATTTEATTTTAAFRSPTDLMGTTFLDDGGTRFETEPLGMQVNFELPYRATIQYARPGEFQVVGQSDAGLAVVVAGRIGGWYTKDEAGDIDYLGEGSIAPENIDEWIADNGLIATRLPDAEVAGRTAVVYDFALDPDSDVEIFECPVVPCSFLFTVPTVSFDPVFVHDPSTSIDEDILSRIWLFEVEGSEPLAIFAAGLRDEGAEAFIDRFEAEVLPTIEIGPDAPSMPLQ